MATLRVRDLVLAADKVGNDAICVAKGIDEQLIEKKALVLSVIPKNAACGTLLRNRVTYDVLRRLIVIGTLKETAVSAHHLFAAMARENLERWVHVNNWGFRINGIWTCPVLFPIPVLV